MFFKDYQRLDNTNADHGCGITIISSSSCSSLYKEKRQVDSNLPIDICTDVPIDRWNFVSSVNESASRNIFDVVANLLVEDSIARGQPLIQDEVKEDTKDTAGFDANEHPLSQTQNISFVNINWLKEHEQIVSEERVQKLHDAIVGWNAYKLPLLVDSRSGAILDGHHRYAVGRMMGLSRLPVVLVDYLNDDSISVDVWPECGFDCLTKEDVVEMSLSDRVYPPKTSKHEFVASFTPIDVPLSKLR